MNLIVAQHANMLGMFVRARATWRYSHTANSATIPTHAHTHTHTHKRNLNKLLQQTTADAAAQATSKQSRHTMRRGFTPGGNLSSNNDKQQQQRQQRHACKQHGTNKSNNNNDKQTDGQLKSCYVTIGIATQQAAQLNGKIIKLIHN